MQELVSMVVSALIGGVIAWVIQERRLGHQDTQARKIHEREKEREIDTRRRDDLRSAIGEFRQKIKDGFYLQGLYIYDNADYLYLSSITPENERQQLDTLWTRYKYLVQRKDVPEKFVQIEEAKQALIIYLGSMQSKYA